MRKLFLIATFATAAGCNNEDADHSRKNEVNDALVFDTGTGTLSLTDEAGTLIADLSALEDDADADPDNEAISTIALNGTSLNIVEGLAMLTVDLSSLADDADADPSNELQTLSFDDQTRLLSLSGANQVAIPDAQTLSVDAGALSVSGGNTVNLPGQVRTFYVSPGANPTASGDALRDTTVAVNALASAAAPYTIVVEPGVYELGGSGLTVGSFVSLQGAGELVTTIQSQSTDAVVSCSTNSTLRDLTVRSNVSANGLGLSVAGFVNLRNVYVFVENAGASNTGITVQGTYNVFDHIWLRVEAASTAFAIISSSSGSALVRDSRIHSIAASNVLFHDTLSIGVRLFGATNTQLEGAAPAAGLVGCIGTYSLVMNPYACP